MPDVDVPPNHDNVVNALGRCRKACILNNLLAAARMHKMICLLGV
jgi:hypothetical protein